MDTMSKLFRVLHESTKSQARMGEIRTAHGKVGTPAFMPIATRGVVKTLAAADMRDLGAQILLSNTYHLFVRPGLDVIKKSGGLHKFMGWDGPILTDSGGYQVFSLAQKRRPPLNLPLDKGEKTISSPFEGEVRRGLASEVDYDVRITRDGAEFIDRLSGRKDRFTPERVLDIQRDFGVDIAMVLDVCAEYPISNEKAKHAMELTTEWARRSRQYVIASEAKQSHIMVKRSPRPFGARDDSGKNLFFGIVQGSVYRDLREQSARDITALDFDGYAIGGVAVGETARQKRQVVDWVVPHLPEDKPRYLMGLGQPEEIVAAVRSGIDMFDCVLPTRNARHGNLYVWNPRFRHPERSEGSRPNGRSAHTREILRFAQNDRVARFYNVMHITNEKYRTDFKSVDPHCACFTCINHTRAYLRHLFKVGEPLAARLATIHNVKFYLDLMTELRRAITMERL